MGAVGAHEASQVPTSEPASTTGAPQTGSTAPQAGEQVIADRTPEQQARDTDIEMTDVGPSIPLSASEAATIPQEETFPTEKAESTVDLPPPPPLDEREAQVVQTGGMAAQTQGYSESTSPAEVQKGLLPIMRPEHRGRKCLILDLDETLVHSSFKVRQCFLHSPYA